jgi:hypothetical protein
MGTQHENLKKIVLLKLSNLGFLCWGIPTGMAYTLDGNPIRFGVLGHSDVVAYKNGLAYFIEIKVRKDSQRDSQELFQKAVENHGCQYIIIKDNADNLEAISKEWDKRITRKDPSRKK